METSVKSLMSREELLEAIRDLQEVNKTAPGVSETFTRLLASLAAYVGDTKRAAAEDLYEALEYFVGESHYNDSAFAQVDNDSKARAALAKARGETT